MTLPNFLIIGATKSGTTSLYYYLKEHPQIYMSPIRETEYFSFMGESLDREDYRLAPANFATTDRKAYETLFKGVRKETAIGECSPYYLYHPEAARRIRENLPHAKLIAILRDPAERAYSHFIMRCNKANPNLAEPIRDFAEALHAEDIRVQNGWLGGWHYKRRGFYYAQLKRYFDLFPSEQIRVYLYEDLRSNPQVVLRDIFRFLGVLETFQDSTNISHGFFLT